ncbi:MAG: FAD:protein FMN transferase [Thermoleophilaceae bacterium]
MTVALAASARPWVSATWTALGTQADVLVTEPRAMRDVQQLVAHQLDEIDLACSRFREDSELAHINRSPGRWVKVSQLFFDALEAALGAASASGGAVDPTLGRVLRLAGYDRDFADVRRAPGPARLMLTRAPGWKKIQVDYVHRAVRLPHGVELDLGATAKALAADRAATDAARLTHAGVLVNLGGDLAVAGPAPDGGWPVRVTDDHAAGFDAPGQTVPIESGGLATSSTTVRRWQSGGRELHHIFDPRNGRPAAPCWRTVSVAAATCVAANTASTAAIVRGADAAEWLTERDLPARLVHVSGRVVHAAKWPAEAHA